MSAASVKTMTPQALRRYLESEDELALLDVREEGVFGAGHLFFAVPLPLSRLELKIRDFVPRLDAPVVLCDGGGGERRAQTAAERMARWGYTDVAVLEDGVAGWRAAEGEVFSGVNVPSKAFGEFVEHTYGTPSLPPEELYERMGRGDPMVVLDSRPMDEYRVMNIPTGIDCPGAELVYRVRDLAPDPETTVVVNCAGRTRSIIGAQSLINAGIPNKVIALRNGTMGWHLAGFQLEQGQQRRAPEVTPEGLEAARAAVRRVAQRFGVRTCTREDLAAWQADTSRTTYLLDVRDDAEYEAGHLPGSRHAPGGQLVQATDRYVAVRNARLVLLDDTEVRATMTASWLLQMGWPDVVVLAGGIGTEGLATGPHQPEVPGLADADVPEVEPAELSRLVDTGRTMLLDLGRSLDYKAGHIPGAWFAIRAELDEALRHLPPHDTLVLTSPDGVLARLAAPEARALGQREVRVLAGGTARWVAEERPLESGLVRKANEPTDVFLRPYDRDEGQEAAMHGYLSWEVDLVEQVKREGGVRFRAFAE